MFGGDEISRPGYTDPRQGTETCGFVEEMNSDQHMLRITGDAMWADHAENVAFNSYPAAVMPDFKSLRYITSPNMVLNDSKDHSPGIFNKGPFLMMNPFSSRCCQHNHSQGWPYYSENLWMATPDNGVAAVLYTASKVNVKVGNGEEVQFDQETNYPFEDDLLFTLTSQKSVYFPLYLPVPAWCSNAELWINGKKQNIQIPAAKYIKIERQWNNNDKIKLKLPMEISVNEWKDNKNSVSVNYGPLTLSLKIDENYIKKESDKTAIGDSRWQKNVDKDAWPSIEIHPVTDWNYALYLPALKNLSFKVIKKPWPENNFPFTTTDAPIVVTAKAKQVPEWTIDKYGLCGELMQSPVATTAPVKEITLIPMGAARLRISQFPVAE